MKDIELIAESAARHLASSCASALVARSVKDRDLAGSLRSKSLTELVAALEIFRPKQGRYRTPGVHAAD